MSQICMVKHFEACVVADKKQKHSFRSLMSITSDIVTIVPYIEKLGKLLDLTQ